MKPEFFKNMVHRRTTLYAANSGVRMWLVAIAVYALAACGGGGGAEVVSIGQNLGTAISTMGGVVTDSFGATVSLPADALMAVKANVFLNP